MKKLIVLFLIVVSVLLTSCNSVIQKTVNVPEYLSDCDAQYNEEDEQYLVSFGLKDKSKKYIASIGTAKIVFKDKTKNKLYDKTIKFSEKDFSDYTSKLWKGTRYLCGLYIDTKEITPAASDEGVAELTITAADGQAVFDTEKIELLDLPTKEIDIKNQKLPKKLSYIDFDNKETVYSVTDVSYKTEIMLDSASVEAKATVKMIKNNIEKDDFFTVKCVLKDSKGVEAASEEEYCEYISNGESKYVTFDFTDLDANESYTLSFKDASE